MSENSLSVKIKQRYDTEANWSSINPILLEGEIAISSDKGLFKIGNGTSTWSTLSYNNANTANNATSATKLTTPRTIQTNLASTSTASFDGSANITPGVTGTLSASNGGTGQTTTKAAANAFINSLETGSSTPQDADYYVSQYVGGGTTTTTYHRRPMSALWEYIKGKISSILGLTASSYGGNSATSTKAAQDSVGQQINTTYIKGLSVSGKVITYTKGDGSTGTITTQDTTYSVATTSANGLMASSDKTKLNEIPSPTTSDNDKILSVVNGAYSLISVTNAEGVRY